MNNFIIKYTYKLIDSCIKINKKNYLIRLYGVPNIDKSRYKIL